MIDFGAGFVLDLIASALGDFIPERWQKRLSIVVIAILILLPIALVVWFLSY